MSKKIIVAGVFAAAITPMRPDYTPDYEAIPELLKFLAERGCHGALLLGTTGEGPSFDTQERIEVFRAGLKIREEKPDFRLLAGTGTPSLSETVRLTQAAFDLGFDGAVVLPPYYYHQATDEGLRIWFRELIKQAVPGDGYIFGYNIPAQSRVPLSLDLLANLKDEFPTQFAGIKDSTGDPQFAQRLGEQFGRDLVVLNGNDALFSHALENQAAGCITAMGNLFSPDLRVVWDAHQAIKKAPEAQERLKAQRTVLSKYTPYPCSIKALIARLNNFPLWAVRPPLQLFPEDQIEKALQELAQIESQQATQ
jgi:4-hydroxy-tetrahydrodipicolinate synthase